MKKNKIIVRVISTILAVENLCVFGGCKNQKDNIDDNISLKDDFYLATNKDIINEIKLKDYESCHNIFFSSAAEKIDKRIRSIAKDIVFNQDKFDKDSNEYKMGVLYESFMNKKDDISPLIPYIKKIDSSKDINEFINNVININEKFSDNFLISASLDFNRIDKSKIDMVISGLSLTAEKYINPEYSSALNAITEYREKLLNLFGYNEQEAKDVVNKLNGFYKEIAKNTLSLEEKKDDILTNNIIKKEELKNLFSNINVEKLINEYEGEYDNIKISDIKEAEAINKYLTNENLDILKEHIKLCLLGRYANMLDSKYRQAELGFRNKLLGTQNIGDSKREEAINFVLDNFQTTISKKYIEKYADQKVIKDFEKMIKELISEYKLRLKNNDWLSEETKKKAILKLDNMKVEVGCPKDWEKREDLYKLSDNYFNNIININKADLLDYENGIINHEERWKYGWAMEPNAANDMTRNVLVFSISILASDMYSDKNTYYQNLGSFGSIIGHEISHAFDNQGSLLDEKGNMKNWWTDEDKKAFQERVNKVIDYYNKYEINGMKINGKLTVGENIADLGGFSCCVAIAKKKNATKEEMKELFESYAKTWANKYTDEFLKYTVQNDTHAPDKIRVNAVVSSIDEFYDLYDIKEGDGMYKAPQDRIKVW